VFVSGFSRTVTGSYEPGDGDVLLANRVLLSIHVSVGVFRLIGHVGLQPDPAGTVVERAVIQRCVRGRTLDQHGTLEPNVAQYHGRRAIRLIKHCQQEVFGTNSMMIKPIGLSHCLIQQSLHERTERNLRACC